MRPWSGFANKSWPGGSVSTGIQPPTASGDDLAALYAEALQTNASSTLGVGALWAWNVAAWPYTLSGALVFSYSWSDRMHFAAQLVHTPDPLEQRATLEAAIRAANPNLRTLEWENNAPGGFTNHRITVRATVRGTVYDNPNDQAARRNPHPFNGTNDSRTSVRIVNPAAIVADAFGSPAMTPSELAYPTSVTMTDDADYNRQMQLHFNEELGQLPVLDASVTEVTLPISDSVFADRFDTQMGGIWLSFAAADWSVDGMFGRGYPPPGTGFNLSVTGTVDYFTDYLPPRYRLTFFEPDDPVPTLTGPTPWLRAVQRSDGLGAGSPPRAVQLATLANSLRNGPNAIP